MPLPWKTVKSTRLSQLVNDHLRRSQKRRDGSPLFVETGFPTSLVDLFIKKREKLNKSPKKKKPQTPPNPIPDHRDPVISPLITGSPPISPPPVIKGFVDGSDEREFVSEMTGVDANTVLTVGLKMFLVLVLALGTKRLTVGITVSALLLYILEYVGKHSSSVLIRFESTLRLLRFKEDSKMEQETRAAEDETIQLVSCYETKPEEVAVVVREEESNGLKRKSRRAKIRSKMKSLVTKKFRCSRKEEIGGDNSVFLDDRESDNTSESSSSSSRGYKGDDDCVTPTLGDLSGSVMRREEKRAGIIENWRYSFVCVVVLAGLVGGRVFAVIVTLLSWFLMLKSDGKFVKCMMKVPVIEYS